MVYLWSFTIASFVVDFPDSVVGRSQELRKPGCESSVAPSQLACAIAAPGRSWHLLPRWQAPRCRMRRVIRRAKTRRWAEVHGAQVRHILQRDAGDERATGVDSHEIVQRVRIASDIRGKAKLLIEMAPERDAKISTTERHSRWLINVMHFGSPRLDVESADC